MAAHKGVVTTPRELRRLYWDENLSLRDIGLRYGLAKHSILDRMKVAGIRRRDNKEAARMWNYSHSLTEEARVRISNFHTRKLNLTLNEQFAYLLGVILGDGCWYGKRGKNFTIQIAPGLDESFANECISLLYRIGVHSRKDLKLPRKPQHNSQWLVEARSKALHDFLERLNLERLKVMLGVDGLRLAFWRGFARAEGYVTKKGGIEISNTDGDLMDWGREVMCELGCQSHLYTIDYSRSGRKPLYRLYIGKRELDRLAEVYGCDMRPEKKLVHGGESLQ